MAITPNPSIVSKQIDADRERRFGLLRSIQRKAAPLIILLRELGEIDHDSASIELTVRGDEAISISVREQIFSLKELEQCAKGAIDNDPAQ